MNDETSFSKETSIINEASMDTETSVEMEASSALQPDRVSEWAQLHAGIEACRACPLCQQIHHKVPGQGDPNAPLMIIGEGPGETEDLEGLAFVGETGKLLTRMLDAIGMPRDRVYICNTVKCRPPRNRTPEASETQACFPFLERQIQLVRPKVLLLMGRPAAATILGETISITRTRGTWFERDGMYALVTYHPSALLRDPGNTRFAWQDLQSLRDRLMDLKLYPDLYGPYL